MEEITQADCWLEENAYAIEALLSDNGEVTARGKKHGMPAVSYTWAVDTNADNAIIRKRKEKRAFKIAVFRVMRQLEPDIVLPWGSLTGIRPTKLLRELIEEMGEREALRVFTEDFDVRSQKAALAASILSAQKNILRDISPLDADVYIWHPVLQNPLPVLFVCLGAYRQRRRS